MAYQVSYNGQTTTAVAKEIFQIDGTRFPIAYNASYRIQGTMLASDSVSYAAKEWEFTVLIKNISGVVSLVGTVTKTVLKEDIDATTWDITLTADDVNNALGFSVTGATGRTINWSGGFNYDSIGYTPTPVVTGTKLSIPQIVDIIKQHHPKVSYTLMAQMLSTAQTKFIAASKLNSKRSTILLTGQTLVGTTKGSPLILTDIDSTYSWSFYKDVTTPTVTLKSNTSVMFFSNIVCIDSNGGEVNEYSVIINHDGSVLFYDYYGKELTNFGTSAAYLNIEFIKNPDILTVSSSSIPEIRAEYHEALAHYVISDLYMTRTDIPMIERLQASKHYKNLYDEYELKARYDYNLQSNLFSVNVNSGDFSE